MAHPSLRANPGDRPRPIAPRGARRATRGLLLAAAALAAAGPAAADSFYCNAHRPPVGARVWYCAGSETTGAIGWGPVTSQPDAAGPSPVAASGSGSNGGAFAASASSSASAAPGRLGAVGTSSSFGTGLARAFGAGQAAFWEVGQLAPLPGAIPGAPVSVRLTIDVAGGFASNAAGADFSISVWRGVQSIYSRSRFLSVFGASAFEQPLLPGLVVGDEIALDATLRAYAPSGDTGPTSSTASVPDTARIRIDVTSGNAVFVASSGFDYRTVPEPGLAAMLAAGVATGVGLARRRRLGGAGCDPARHRRLR